MRKLTPRPVTGWANIQIIKRLGLTLNILIQAETSPEAAIMLQWGWYQVFEQTRRTWIRVKHVWVWCGKQEAIWQQIWCTYIDSSLLDYLTLETKYDLERSSPVFCNMMLKTLGSNVSAKSACHYLLLTTCPILMRPACNDTASPERLPREAFLQS